MMTVRETITMEAIAVIVGSISVLTELHIMSGRVVPLTPLINIVMISSSKDVTKAKIAEEIRDGLTMGSVLSKNVLNFDAPRLCAALSILGFTIISPDDIVDTT